MAGRLLSNRNLQIATMTTTVQPDHYEAIGDRYTEALMRSARDTKWNLTLALSAGWTIEAFRHWVDTGQEP